MNADYGFTDSISRCAKVTDYAKAKGVYWSTHIDYLDNGYYWLRSPSNQHDSYANCVRYDGNCYIFDIVDEIDKGVRVSCTINLE